jgi:hypothetical protein
MTTKEETRKRSAMLKELRKTHQETIKRTKLLLKEHGAINKISQAIDKESKTVPEIAEVVGEPTHRVLWYVTAMKKYGVVMEDGMNGGYILYKKVEA